ncbi:MAG: tyrosine-type recombinase/integrase [Actinobacteria bacterium]|nr:tyrosine-type recombinase/integrase [Actinomycetota bacterium]MCA1697463.1 tyrosine-type recombinase/integrase [Actinomycetota bacterium]
MSPLAETCDEYLALRRALGFKLKRHGRLLPDLVAYLHAAGETTVTTRLALEWATQPAGHPQEWAVRLSIARGFARYLRTLDGRAEVPPADLLPRCRRRPRPYLYSDTEIAALMAATETLRFPLTRATYRTLLGLLAVTGVRVGEAIGLDRTDVNFSTGCVTVRGGKFGAARELPLHPSTLRALGEYSTVRDQRWPRPASPAFFLSGAGTRLFYENLYKTFRGLLEDAGIRAVAGSGTPRIHSLRHTYDDAERLVSRGARRSSADAQALWLSRARGACVDLLVSPSDS